MNKSPTNSSNSDSACQSDDEHLSLGDEDDDNEETIDEEEEMCADNDLDEIDALQKEADLPLEQLYAMYGVPGTSTSFDIVDPVVTTSLNPRSYFSRRPAARPRVRHVESLPNCISDAAENRLDGLHECSSSSNSLANEDNNLDALTSTDDDILNDESSVNGNGDQNIFMNQTAHLHSDFEEFFRRGYLDDDDNDVEFFPREPWKKEIKIGPEYQACVPDYEQDIKVASKDFDKEELLWSPSTELDEAEVVQYLRCTRKLIKSNGDNHLLAQDAEIKSDATCLTGADELDAKNGNFHKVIADDEQALQKLLHYHYNVEDALKHQHSLAMKNEMWPESDIDAFEQGLLKYGKNFFQIKQNLLQDRSVAEIVYFYYRWKKTERHDIFVANHRIEKRQYFLHPCVTDFMEHYLNSMDDRDHLLQSQSSHRSPALSFPFAASHMVLYNIQQYQHHFSLHPHPSVDSSENVNLPENINGGSEGESIITESASDSQTVQHLPTTSEFPDHSEVEVVCNHNNTSAVE